MTKRDLLLWTSILVPPVMWFLSLSANFALAPLACGGMERLAPYIVSGGTLLVTAWTGFLAYSLQQGGQQLDDRPHAMAVAGTVLSAGFFLVIAAQSIPQFLLTGCE